MTRPLAAAAALFLVLGCGLFPLRAQIPGLPGKDKSASQAPETPQQTRERLQGSLDELRAQLSRLDEPAAESQLPEGISNAEYNDRRRDVQQAVASLDRHLKNLSAASDAAAEAAKARQARSEWHGFSETPPFSVLMVDDLRNQREVAEEKKATAASAISLIERSGEETRKAVSDADAEARRMEENAAANAKDAAARWRADAAKARQRMLTARAGAAASAIVVQKTLLASADDTLALLDAKIRTAAPRQAFLKDDLSNVKKASAGRQAEIRKEIDSLDRRLRTASSERRKLEPVPGADGKLPPVDDLLRLRMDAADTRVEALQFARGQLESLSNLENQLVSAYELRNTLMTSGDPDARAAALKSLEDTGARMAPMAIYFGQELKLTGAELREQEARASSLPAGDPKLEPVNLARDSLREKRDTLQRVILNIEQAQGLIQRWTGDYDADLRNKTWGERTASFFRTLWRGVRSVWRFEVFHVDDKGITLGRLIIALALFAFGYLLAARITRRLQKAVVSRGRVPDAQAATLRRWLMVLLGFLLVVGTLQVMSIPLTVFAFFGGALAIGLGFGTQTLIKNFISGIIMLFERNIRVGDIVDVGGSVGTVTEINTRSSIIKNADGLETLVPNSVFLENKITNWTHSNRKLRRSIRVGVSYGSPGQKVAEILVECAGRHGRVLKDPEPIALFEDFGENALIFSLYFWVELAGGTNAAAVSSDLRFMIQKRLAEANIAIPTPDKDMRLVTDAPLQVEWAPKSEGL